MSKPLELTGERIGRLTVLRIFGKSKSGNNIWLCKCDCGEDVYATAASLKIRHLLSCGCLRTDVISKLFSTHGGSNLPEYRVWAKMKDRCYNPKNNRYNQYGKRGIKVCDRWLGEDGFSNFISDMGPRPTQKHSIDRFPNNGTGDYEPSNCRWATIQEQTRNRRNNIWVEYEGEQIILKDLATELSVNYNRLYRCVKNGVPMGEAIIRARDGFARYSVIHGTST